MCNHYETPEQMEFAFFLRKIRGVRINFDLSKLTRHAYPKRVAPVAIQEGGERSIVPMRWGVFNVIQGVTKYVTNARNDKLLKSYLWKDAARYRRCLIPGTAYFEPGTGPPGARGEIRFTVKDRPHFFFAGLWEQNPEDPDAANPRAFAMVTTEPNTAAAQFHDRMPVVLSDEEAEAWLGEERLPDEGLMQLCRGLPSEALAHEIIPAMAKAASALPPNPQGELF